MNRQQLLDRFQDPIEVGPHGFVRLVDVMGDDAAAIQAARVSYGAGTKTQRKDEQLIRYMMRKGHTSPFEHCKIKLHVKVPMDIWRQWIRHRTANVNEYSTRYSEAIEDMATTDPGEWRAQSQTNKQGSSEHLTHWPDPNTEKFLARAKEIFPEESQRNGILYFLNHEYHHPGNQTPGQWLSRLERNSSERSLEDYKLALLLGVAREQARKNLLLSNYTEAYWTIDAHNLMHFLKLRLDEHAQLEIREYAQAIYSIFEIWMPNTAQAFQDYVLYAHTFSRREMQVIRDMAELLEELKPELDWKTVMTSAGLENRRERGEFLKALGVTLARQ